MAVPCKIRTRTSLRVATFHARSYGFRTGRSAHDAQKFLFLNLNSKANGKDKRVIELDIEKCFDRISHITIMDNLIAPKGLKLGIFRCLKAGINPEFPEQGTPQGGVVSPQKSEYCAQWD
jgi:retron-type reverse transcriptase